MASEQQREADAFNEALHFGWEAMKARLKEHGFAFSDSGHHLLVEFMGSDRETIVGQFVRYSGNRHYKMRSGFSPLKGATEADHREYRERQRQLARGENERGGENDERSELPRYQLGR